MTSRRDESPTGTSKTPSSPSNPNKSVRVVFGTRPEAIKLYAVVSALRKGPFCCTLETIVCVTAQHRQMLDQVLGEAVSALAEHNDVQVVCPVHPNPNVQERVHRIVGRHSNVLLVEPVDYLPFVDLMRRAYLLITDSGGVQEEGPSLGKPILVLRDKTERPEAVRAGTVKLVGTNRDAIISEATRLLDDPPSTSEWLVFTTHMATERPVVE